jgi:hypothetical protein
MLKGGKIMFNFVPQFFKVVFNTTRNLLISFFTLQLQQQWRNFRISIQIMIFPKIQFPFKLKNLLFEEKTLSVGLCRDLFSRFM